MKVIANGAKGGIDGLTTGRVYETDPNWPAEKNWVRLLKNDEGVPQQYWGWRFDEVHEISPGLEKPMTTADVYPNVSPIRDPKEKDTNPKAAIGVRKVPFSVIPMDVIAEVGLAMLEGSAKYGRHNYRAAGARASVYFDGTMRHLIQWWEGEDTDPDAKGVNHITKAIASLTVLRAAMLAGKFEDDRPPRTGIDWPALNEQAAAIIDMHAAKTPKHYTQKDSE